MKMENPTILIIRNVKVCIGSNYFPESLKVIEWHEYHTNCLPYNFDPNNLVICKLTHSCFTSFGFHGSSKKFENLTVLKFDKCQFLTEIPEVSDLPNLKELSFEGCESLIAVHDSVGFLTKLKILNAQACIKLKSFPPLNMTSLERLELSLCSSLKNFPELSGEMPNIRDLNLNKLPIEELPVSFQNLTGLRGLRVNCEFLWLSRIVFTPKLMDIRIHNCKGWLGVNSEEGEEEVDPIIRSRLYLFSARMLNDDFILADFMQLALVTVLDLWRNDVTFLPECIKEFHHLYSLNVSECKHLQEIRGVPPRLLHFRAINCISLTSSSSRMMLNQQHHKCGKADFIFPGTSIPEWFDQKRRGPSISFWFRKKFPLELFCFLIAPVTGSIDVVRPMVFINGVQEDGFLSLNEKMRMELDCYTHLFEIPSEVFRYCKQYADKEWNHVKITFEGVFDTSSIKAMGIHLVKRESRDIEMVRFEDPYINTKEDNHLNTSQSQNHSFENIALKLTRKFSIASFLFFACFLFFTLFTSLIINPT